VPPEGTSISKKTNNNEVLKDDLLYAKVDELRDCQLETQGKFWEQGSYACYGPMAAASEKTGANAPAGDPYREKQKNLLLLRGGTTVVTRAKFVGAEQGPPGDGTEHLVGGPRT